MAFVVSTLQKDIEDVFASMNDGDNHVFSDGISNAIVTFVGTGEVSTSDAGTVPGGVYSGSGSGSLSVTAIKCAKIIYDACEAMNSMSSGGDGYLAEKIGEGIQQMADDGVVSTTVTGTLTPPSSAPVSPYGGSATGKISCDNTNFISDLKGIFSDMWNNRGTEGYDGDKAFAEGLAQAVYDFWTSGLVSTDGEGNIEGSSGSGSIA
jgi:hypothetical protein